MKRLQQGTPQADSPEPRVSARAKAARLREEDVRRERRRQRVLTVAIVGAAVAIGGGLIALALVGQSGNRTAATAADLAPVSGLGAEAMPPWPAPSDTARRAEVAGLPLGPMGTAEHYHAHLDVLVDGESVEVPANIGIETGTGVMSALHTHSNDGVVHIEAGRSGQPFTLGQLFTEWDVRLTPNKLGGLTAGNGKSLRVYVDGDQVEGDPAMIKLESGQQIAIVFGPADADVDVPESYEFAPGE